MPDVPPAARAVADLRYPIGRYAHAGPVTPADRRRWIDDIAALPDALRDAVTGLSAAQLDTRYRPEGWTIRQVVHHVADSHLNAFVRYKWTLTEDRPVIKAYDERAWAETPDVAAVPVATSLAFLVHLHTRWVGLLDGMDEAAWARTFVHPVSGETPLDRMLGLYAWHGRHHLAHITTTAKRERW